MRRSLLAMFLAVFLLPSMQCGGNESLDVFNGKLEIVTSPFTKEYKYLPYIYFLRHDTLRWMYEYPANGESRVNLILSGRIETDSLDDYGDTIPIGIGDNHIEMNILGQTGGLPGTVPIAFGDSGIFLDTVPVAVSSVPGVLLPCSTSLLINVDAFIFDTLPLVGPQGAVQGEDEL